MARQAFGGTRPFPPRAVETAYASANIPESAEENHPEKAFCLGDHGDEADVRYDVLGLCSLGSVRSRSFTRLSFRSYLFVA